MWQMWVGTYITRHTYFQILAQRDRTQKEKGLHHGYLLAWQVSSRIKCCQSTSWVVSADVAAAVTAVLIIYSCCLLYQTKPFNFERASGPTNQENTKHRFKTTFGLGCNVFTAQITIIAAMCGRFCTLKRKLGVFLFIIVFELTYRNTFGGLAERTGFGAFSTLNHIYICICITYTVYIYTVYMLFTTGKNITTKYFAACSKGSLKLVSTHYSRWIFAVLSRRRNDATCFVLTTFPAASCLGGPAGNTLTL